MRRQRASRIATSTGFTIVELLIVIVVIAILATLVVVAYRGITDQANVSAAQSSASQVAKQLQNYANEHSDEYPATLAAASINNTSGVTFQYYYNNDTSPRTYCATATAATVSYYVTHSSLVPTIGSCQGHVNGGGAKITNWALNPTGKLGTIGWAVNHDGGSGTFYSRAATGGGLPMNVDTVVTAEWATASTGATGGVELAVPVRADLPYRASLYFRYGASSSGMRCDVIVKDATGATLLDVNDVSLAVSNNSWGQCGVIFTTPANAASATVRVWRTGIVSAGRTLDATAVMLVEGSAAYSFADGNSPGWVWSGRPNESASVGAPL